ncbi:MAG: LLM class flavin-dependent oxidoreductase [Steroidobacteraceae bacterium]
MTIPTSIVQPDLTSIATIFPDFDAYFESAPLIALAAAKTKTIQFGYGPLDVVRRHPSMMAQMFNTLDHVSGHRVFVILANGENKQMKPYGISRKGANEKLMDTLPMLHHWLRSKEPLTFEGKQYKAVKGKVAVQPLGAEPPQVLLAGGGQDVLELAGRYGDGWMTYIPGSMEDDPELYNREVTIVKEAARAARRDPDKLRIMPLILTVLHDDPSMVKKALDNPFMKWNALGTVPSGAMFEKWGLKHPYGAEWNFSRDCIPPWLSREDVLDACSRVPPEALPRTVFIGDAEQVFERLQPWLRQATDPMIINWATFCGLEFIEGCRREEARLIGMIRKLR